MACNHEYATHHMACDCREAHFAALEERVKLLEARLNWLANETMYCDYGDNEHGAVAWHFHKYNGAKASIIGGSIDAAIDAAREALNDPR